jgi:hypothetical protein
MCAECDSYREEFCSMECHNDSTSQDHMGDRSFPELEDELNFATKIMEEEDGFLKQSLWFVKKDDSGKSKE